MFPLRALDPHQRPCAYCRSPAQPRAAHHVDHLRAGDPCFRYVPLTHISVLAPIAAHQLSPEPPTTLTTCARDPNQTLVTGVARQAWSYSAGGVSTGRTLGLCATGALLTCGLAVPRYHCQWDA